MPGSGEVMEGAMQQAAQEGRQFIGRDYICYLRDDATDLIQRSSPLCKRGVWGDLREGDAT